MSINHIKKKKLVTYLLNHWSISTKFSVCKINKYFWCHLKFKSIKYPFKIQLKRCEFTDMSDQKKEAIYQTFHPINGITGRTCCILHFNIKLHSIRTVSHFKHFPWLKTIMFNICLGNVSFMVSIRTPLRIRKVRAEKGC